MIKLVRNYKDLIFPDGTIEEGYDIIFGDTEMTEEEKKLRKGSVDAFRTSILEECARIVYKHYGMGCPDAGAIADEILALKDKV